MTSHTFANMYVNVFIYFNFHTFYKAFLLKCRIALMDRNSIDIHVTYVSVSRN